MNLEIILRDYLEDNSYDGLFIAGECSCELHDFMHCGNPMPICSPGYKGKDLTCDCEPDIQYYISREKNSGCPYCE